MTETTGYPELDAHVYQLNAYYVTAAEPSGYGTPYVTLHCPNEPKRDDDPCLLNLLPADERRKSVALSRLWELTIEHDLDRHTIDGRSLAAVAVDAYDQVTEEMKAAGRAELVERLTALRHSWANRQQEAICIRETADGASAFIASARADLIGQLLVELDQVVNGG